MTEPESCGGQHVLIVAGDGRKGFPGAITAAFPEKAIVQTCIIYPVRHAVNVCAWKDRKLVPLACDLQRNYCRDAFEGNGPGNMP